jgi:hypothetical protein
LINANKPDCHTFDTPAEPARPKNIPLVSLVCTYTLDHAAKGRPAIGSRPQALYIRIVVFFIHHRCPVCPGNVQNWPHAIGVHEHGRNGLGGNPANFGWDQLYGSVPTIRAHDAHTGQLGIAQRTSLYKQGSPKQL